MGNVTEDCKYFNQGHAPVLPAILPAVPDPHSLLPRRISPARILQTANEAWGTQLRLPCPGETRETHRLQGGEATNWLVPLASPCLSLSSQSRHESVPAPSHPAGSGAKWPCTCCVIPSAGEGDPAQQEGAAAMQNVFPTSTDKVKLAFNQRAVTGADSLKEHIPLLSARHISSLPYRG